MVKGDWYKHFRSAWGGVGGANAARSGPEVFCFFFSKKKFLLSFFPFVAGKSWMPACALIDSHIF